MIRVRAHVPDLQKIAVAEIVLQVQVVLLRSRITQMWVGGLNEGRREGRAGLKHRIAGLRQHEWLERMRQRSRRVLRSEADLQSCERKLAQRLLGHGAGVAIVVDAISASKGECRAVGELPGEAEPGRYVRQRRLIETGIRSSHHSGWQIALEV